MPPTPCGGSKQRSRNIFCGPGHWLKLAQPPAKKSCFLTSGEVKGQIQAIDDGDLKPEHVTQIATQLDVSEREVISMNQRMAGNDRSLNVPLSRDGDGTGEWQDWLEDDSTDQETNLLKWRNTMRAAI